MSSPQWMIYGANGYTGRRIAAEAAARGMRPVLAGRHAGQIEPLAAQLGCPQRVFSLASLREMVEALSGMRLVLHCAGPFSATAAVMQEACIQARVHYLDITGEIDCIEAAAARHERALRAEITLLPAVGADVVPSDCLAALLAQRLPGATRLQLFFSGLGQISPGTAKTVLQMLPGGGRIRRAGQLQRVPTAWKTMEISLGGRTRWAITVPLADVASAWYSTQIPHIETYIAMPLPQIRWLRRLRWLMPLAGVPLPCGWKLGVLRWFLGTHRGGGERSFYAGRVTDAQGQSCEGSLETPDAYRLTVLTALACVERLLGQPLAAGFTTPAKAFGAEFIRTIDGVAVKIPDSLTFNPARRSGDQGM